MRGKERWCRAAAWGAAAVVLLALGGCRGAEEREAREVGADPGAEAAGEGIPGTAGEVPDGEAATAGYFEGGEAAAGLGASTVEVRLHGRTVEMPASLPAGSTTFVVANTGDEEHSFEIEGNGVEVALPQPLAPGANASLTVELLPGTYTVYCPVGDHHAEGMVTTLQVVG